MTNHKHLRQVIEDIYVNNNELTKDLALRLMNEFRYSKLYIPAKKENGTLNFIIYEDNGLKFTPLFTDPDEFDKFFNDKDDFKLMQNFFELYQNILKTTEIDGYILNPSSEKYLFRADFILSIKNIPKTNYISTDTYSIEELKNFTKSKNENLEAFINNNDNIGDFEGLFEVLSQSVLQTLIVSDIDLTDKSCDGVINMVDVSNFTEMYTDNVGGVYGTLFSSTSKISDVKTDKFKYSQIVNLSMFVNFILSEDMDGIILNPESCNVLIPRSILLNYSLGFEKFACDDRLSDSIYYMFLTE